MMDNDLRKLISEADSCYRNGEYSRELQLRLQICSIEPGNPYYEHNLALALRNNGELDAALKLFRQLAAEHPRLSRVHNNLATTLKAMGTDPNELVPVFMSALRTADNVEDFTNHFLNTCGAIAYGMDDNAEEAFRLIENGLPEILKAIPPPNLVEKNIRTMQSILSAYREIGAYRQAFAQRKWRSAESALDRAKGKLAELGLHNFVKGVDTRIVPCFALSRDVMEVLEEIAVGNLLAPKAALDRYEMLLQNAVSLTEEHGPYSFQAGWLNVIRLFLVGAVQALRFLNDPCIDYKSNKSLRRELTERTPSAYMDVTRDLVSVLAFLDAQCLDLVRRIDSVVKTESVLIMRDEAWTRIALLIRGLAFNFGGVDIGLARSLLEQTYDPLVEARYVLRGFKAFVERQAYKDILVKGRPQENIARALLQAYLEPRSYREVPVRGGFSDILSFSKNGRFVYETKVWRGIEYYEQGLREIGEYMKGEADDNALIGVFYVVFDGTSTRSAEHQLKGPYPVVSIQGRGVEVVVVSLVPPKPSSME